MSIISSQIVSQFMIRILRLFSDNALIVLCMPKYYNKYQTYLRYE